MTDARFISIVTMCGAIAAPLIGVANGMLSHVREQRNAASREKVEQLEKNTNGINKALLKVTGDAEFAKGVKQGEDHPR